MKAGCCGDMGVIFSTFSTLCLSETAGFSEQDVKLLGFFLYSTVVQFKKKKESLYFPTLLSL